MSTILILYRILVADFLERVRRYSFLVVLGFTVLMGYLFVPDASANYTILNMGGYRGLYNSAWVGMMAAISTTVFLTLPGFYLVKNSISRDYETRVGQIIAATPITKLQYILGKFLSNFILLATIVAVLAITAIGMQLVRGESYHIQLLVLFAPFLIITLPAMVVIAASAVLFESIPWLRGSFGNIVWFFVWIVLIINGASSSNDILGIGRVLDMLTDFVANHLGVESVGVTIASFVQHQETGIFTWVGMNWASFAVNRLIWVLAFLMIPFISAGLFNRFNPSNEMSRNVIIVKYDKLDISNHSKDSINVLDLPAATTQFSFLRVFIIELLLMFKRLPYWWYVIAASLLVGALLSDGQHLGILLSVSWLWPVAIWSASGCREIKDNTEELVYTSPHIIYRQLPALWLAGATVALVTGSGVLVHVAVQGDWQTFVGIVVGALFISSLAISLGIWSRSSKLFEILYLAFFWYAGLMNGIQVFDFVGLNNPNYNSALAYLIVSLLLMSFAALGKTRQLQR